MASVGKKIAKASGILMGLGFLTTGIGLVKQILIAAQFGTSETMDAYVVAITVVGLILLWLELPISQVIIPMFRYDLARQGEQGAWANISVLFNNLVFVIVVLACAAWLLAPALVSLLSPGFTDSANVLATGLTQIMVISVVFIAAGKILVQILFSYERFFLPGISDLVNNLVVVFAFLALSGTYGIYGLAIAVVLGGICEFASQLPILWEKRKLYQPKLDPRHPGMREMGRLGFPLVLANSGIELARVTDRIFASLLPAGRLSALAFGHRLTNVFLDLFVGPLHKSSFPHFTKLSAEENFEVLSWQYARYLQTIFFFTLPAAIGVA
ncbi:MAG: lipid II flippase MurJ, partial [Candidatus Binatia bacterium]